MVHTVKGSPSPQPHPAPTSPTYHPASPSPQVAGHLSPVATQSPLHQPTSPHQPSTFVSTVLTSPKQGQGPSSPALPPLPYLPTSITPRLQDGVIPSAFGASTGARGASPNAPVVDAMEGVQMNGNGTGTSTPRRRARIFFDSDGDLGLLTGKHVLFVGFGNQSAAQSQNLRDSLPDLKITIYNREDSYLPYAIACGFDNTTNLVEVVPNSDIIMLLIPDNVQARLFNTQIAPYLKPGACIVVASGYNVFYNLLQIPDTVDVAMVAPRMIGDAVRELYTKNKGFPCFVSAEKNATGKALGVALAIARAIGGTRVGAIESSAKEETVLDLFSEQALWPVIISAFSNAFTALSAAGCTDEAILDELYLSGEVREVFDAIRNVGFFEQLSKHSPISQWGQIVGSQDVDSSQQGELMRDRFNRVIHHDVIGRQFVNHIRTFQEDLEVEGEGNPLYRKRRELECTEIAKAEKSVRERLGLKPRRNW